jgi:hypothetical protein
MPTLAREPSPLSALPARLPRPLALRDGQWAAARLDDGDLGPSMLEVVIWVPLAGDAGGLRASDVEAALGPATGAQTVRMNRLAVQAVAPPELSGVSGPSGAVRLAGDDLELTGQGYRGAGFEGGGFFGARVVQLADGLLVAVRTGG